MKYNPINMYKSGALVGLAAIVMTLATAGCQNAQFIRGPDGKLTQSAQRSIERDIGDQKAYYERTGQEGVYCIPLAGWEF